MTSSTRQCIATWRGQSSTSSKSMQACKLSRRPNPPRPKPPPPPPPPRPPSFLPPPPAPPPPPPPPPPRYHPPAPPADPAAQPFRELLRRSPRLARHVCGLGRRSAISRWYRA